MSSLPGLALRLVSSSLSLIQGLAEGAMGVVERVCRNLPDFSDAGSSRDQHQTETAPPRPPRHQGGSAIALERDAVARRTSVARVTSTPTAQVGAPQRAALEISPTLPRAPERERLVVLPTAPGRVFAYWQVSQERRDRVLADLGPTEREETREILRVRLLQAPSGSSPEWRFPLAPRATSRHLEDLPAGCLLEIALGIEASDRFATLCPVVAVRTAAPLPLSSPAASAQDGTQPDALGAGSLRVLPWAVRVTPPSSDEWSTSRAEERRRAAPAWERGNSS